MRVGWLSVLVPSCDIGCSARIGHKAKVGTLVGTLMESPTGAQMGDYLEAYVEHHQLSVRTEVRVDSLRAASDARDGYLITAGPRTYGADHVIVATGAFQRPHVPEFAAQLDPHIRQLHSADYRKPGQLADGPVLVVGVSHSGADLAYEVAAAGHRTILSGKDHGQLPFSVDSRRGVLAWPIMRFIAWNLLTLSTPIGRKMAPQVRKGGGPLLRIRRSDLQRAGVERFEARTIGVSEGRPILADGTVLDVGNVIWGTGFRPDYGWIDLPVIGEDGWPREFRGVVDSSPGLYFLGIPFLYSFTSMLVIGADGTRPTSWSESRGVAGGEIASARRLAPKLPNRTKHLVESMGLPVDLKAVEM